MSVKVAVRVRPFNARQKNLKSPCVISMKDPVTTLKPYNGQNQRNFAFDYSFWSADGYQEQSETGYLSPTTGSIYADQKLVQQKIGKKILDNAWEGYHCCLFAYGQTGSGKSYSMIGYGKNKGIVPITCNEIFERIKCKKQDQDFEVYVSMLEIYNEDVQDLTISLSKRPTGGLQIRQNKILGVYVDGVKKHYVKSYEDIETVMEQGTKNRTVAATQMNATSSRAHTIISIQFKQIKKIGDVKSQRISTINLVDLAGSQRQEKTGATGQRLKEAVGINQSLTNLGQVISVLAENSQKQQKKFVPYRNSSLTRILQNALGGNSQTVMICAISPASDNYDQTLSTLRYADRAKKIKNQPIVNENQTDKLLKQLKQENERLRKLLQQKNIRKTTIKNKADQNNQFNSENDDQNKQNRTTYQCDEDQDDDIQANLSFLSQFLSHKLKTKEQVEQQGKKDLEDMRNNKNYDNYEKILKDSELKNLKQKQNKLPPYLQNISKDFMLNRKLKILLQRKHITIGKRGAKPSCDIIFGGRDMEMRHAFIDIQDNKVTLTPMTQNCHLYVNGNKITTAVQLKHLDRIIFGWNSVYLYKNKDHKRNDQTIESKQIDWEFVKDQVAQLVNIDQSDTEDGSNCCQIY